MADTPVAALDHTIQQTNIWLKSVAEQLHIEDRHEAYSASRSVLHLLRDRLTPEQAVHLGRNPGSRLRDLLRRLAHCGKAN
ncbi:MAG TPA: DUF2267 domain-containing protein [Methylocystis sp.]|nr:DUF2267 domain-containing protein [Methylocystis sp.]